MAEMQDIFQDLDRITLRILKERAANYLFDDDIQNDSSQADSEKNTVNSQTSHIDNSDNASLLDIFDEATKIEENSDAFESDDRIIELRRFSERLKNVHEKRETGLKVLEELNEKYNAVAEKTSSLHHACNQMMSHQTQLAAVNEQIKSNLHYYQQYDWLAKKLQTPKLLLTGTLFTQILCVINECITYLRANIDQKEAPNYLEKYEQCLSRALTTIKTNVSSNLEACREDILYRQSKSEKQNLDDHKKMSLPKAISYVDDDTFALLYGVFGVKAATIRNAFAQAHQFFSGYAEYHAIVSECEQEYFRIRDGLLRPIVAATIQNIASANSSCSFTRDGCVFLLRLCDDEFRLYKQFFILDIEDEVQSVGGNNASPSSPTSLLSMFWQGSDTTRAFDAFIEGLCRIFYDILRPIIIQNSHLETLAQLCTLLKIDMIEERCGISESKMNVDGGTFFNSRAGFVKVMRELVADINERIVYRATIFGQSDILDYNPAAGDLLYPERLVMMQNIKAKGDSDQHKELLHDSTECEIKDSEQTISSESTMSKISASPIDHHCLWYPTVRRTVMCLSKLFRCLDHAVFVSISSELLDACCRSLELAVERIKSIPIDSSKASIKDILNRDLDGFLFIVKHLLILREQTSPYRQHMQQMRHKNSRSSMDEAPPLTPQYDYSLDWSKYTQSMLQLLNPENRSRWFEFGSNNALLSLLLLAPIHVHELQTDSRRIIEAQLKKWCQALIDQTTTILIGSLKNMPNEIEHLKKEESQKPKPKEINDRAALAFKSLKRHWLSVRTAFSLYIGVRETEEILLQPIRRNILTAFSSLNSFIDENYNSEERQVASLLIT